VTPIYLVDAFADRPFAGNPAGVCPLDGPWPADVWMQSVAMEMNQAETAFVRPDGDGWGLRWFTPRVEVDLCGHATLAAAHVLWTTGRADGGLRFRTRSGMLTAARRADGIELDFPAEPASPAADDEVLAALGVPAARFVGRNRFDVLVELPSEAAVRAVAPDFRALATVPARGVIVTARSDDGRYDFVSRFFAPACGIDEDPVTGSAHCCLADYWGRALEKDEMVGYQASARGGVVRVRRAGDRVKLIGTAVTVLEGKLV
jgi:predicted PhzF superfamily epimerase YddE/YHI9